MQKVQKKREKVLPRVIAISSGKGGVGKSSITVNLGISLAKTGAKVCLLDADTGLANANILLGINPQFGFTDGKAKCEENSMFDISTCLCFRIHRLQLANALIRRSVHADKNARSSTASLCASRNRQR